MEASKLHGLTHDSILNKLKYFHVTEGLPCDVMHDLLEGVLLLGLKCLLNEFTSVQKLFTLGSLNTRIVSYPFGSEISDPPKALPAGFTGITHGSPKGLGGMQYNHHKINCLLIALSI